MKQVMEPIIDSVTGHSSFEQLWLKKLSAAGVPA